MWVKTNIHPPGFISDIMHIKTSAAVSISVSWSTQSPIEFHLNKVTLQSRLFLDTQNLIVAHLLKWKLCGKSLQYNNKSNFYAIICVMTLLQIHPEIFENAQTDRRKWGWRHNVGSQSCDAVSPSWAQLPIGSAGYRLLKEKWSRWETGLLDLCGLYGKGQRRLQDC